MSDFERKKQEMEFKAFVASNVIRPTDCRNSEQVRFQLQKLISMMERMRGNGFIPEQAYMLVAQYNARLNRFLKVEFRHNYS